MQAAWRATIPNVLSVIRLMLVPVFRYLLLVRHAYGPAVAILMFSGVSDWADGKIARLVPTSPRGWGSCSIRWWTASTWWRSRSDWPWPAWCRGGWWRS